MRAWSGKGLGLVRGPLGWRPWRGLACYGSYMPTREIDGAASPEGTAEYAERHLGSPTLEVDEEARVIFGALRSRSTAGSRSITEEDIREGLLDPDAVSHVPEAAMQRARVELRKRREERSRVGQLQQLQRLPRRNERTGWTLPPISQSCFRLSSKEMFHHQALAKGIRSGLNVLDTTTIQEESEEVVAAVLQSLLLDDPWETAADESEGDTVSSLKREEVIVTSMAGFLTAERKPSDGKSGPMQPRQITGYSISPEALEAEITRIMSITGTCVDLLYIHNPETMLYLSEKTGTEAEAFVEDALRKAFEHLEMEAKMGRIQYYGVCSEKLVAWETEGSFLSIPWLLSIAESIDPNHHFAAVKYPFNMLEESSPFDSPTAATSLASAAELHGLISASYRPLTAVLPQREMLRLITYPSHDNKDFTALLKEAFELTIMLEKNYPGLGDSKLPPAELFSWGQILSQNHSQIRSLVKWKEILDFQVTPSVNAAISHLHEQGLLSWAPRYHMATQQLFRRMQWAFEHENYHAILPVQKFVRGSSSESCTDFGSGKLQDAALMASISAGASTVSVGIRDEALVSKCIDSLRYRVIPQETLYKHIGAMRRLLSLPN